MSKFRKNIIPVNDTDNVPRIAAFISIPRNASNSVREILNLGANRNCENTCSSVIHENHQRGIVLNSRYDLDKLFTFCFVRNPYTRCVSWYEFHKKIDPYVSLTFKEWVEKGMPHHWQQQNQTDYAKEQLTPLLQCTFTRDCKIDFIGRIENFKNDLKYIVKQLNVICDDKKIDDRFYFQNKKMNYSLKKERIDQYYTDEMRQKVYNILQEDFSHFNYDRSLG